MELLQTRSISIHAPHTGRDIRDICGNTATKKFQSTRPIRGATRLELSKQGPHSDFNPRAPYGARRENFENSHFSSGFQSTRPIRGATKALAYDSNFYVISIHAPHTGRDRQQEKCQEQEGKYFNPRAPYGARPPISACTASYILISIHAPHTGRDYGCSAVSPACLIFQSTRPIRGATI